MILAKIIWFLYKNILKHILFLFNPEKIHELFAKMWYFLGWHKLTKRMTHFFFSYENKTLEQNILGIDFKNPVWLAWGFDKDINLPNIIADVGFGREEVWSITANPYEGNTGKRLARLKKSKWLLVYYWLKNKWVKKIKEILENLKLEVPLFASIAKTNSPEVCEYQKWIEDYIASLRELRDSQNIHGFVINISCPNSFGWEDYTKPERLTGLLQAIQAESILKPILVKLPVDLEASQLAILVEVCVEHNVSWVIIANLTKQRNTILDIEQKQIENLPWGISGKPMQEKSDYLIWEIYKRFGNKILIVWVGWIFNAHDAYNKIKQWASLVQLITGMIFEWPQLIWQINKGLVDLLKKDWYKNISEAIGANYK